jgi:hypothetical protein
VPVYEFAEVDTLAAALAAIHDQQQRLAALERRVMAALGERERADAAIRGVSRTVVAA